MKFYKIKDDTIEFARDILKDELQLNYLAKIYQELNISYEVAFVDDTDNQHRAKKYQKADANNNVNLRVIVMYEYFISNVIFDKSIVISCYIFRNI
jgi:hypothetical protein